MDSKCFRCLSNPAYVFPIVKFCDGKFDCHDFTDECMCTPTIRPEICGRLHFGIACMKKIFLATLSSNLIIIICRWNWWWNASLQIWQWQAQANNTLDDVQLKVGTSTSWPTRPSLHYEVTLVLAIAIPLVYLFQCIIQLGIYEFTRSKCPSVTSPQRVPGERTRD